jgi:hypothetical protein
MNPAQIDRLLADLPPNVNERHRHRVHGYAATARRCDQRITDLRIELERALCAVDEPQEERIPAGIADEMIRLALELDALERVQSRIDSWLRITVGAVSDDPGPAPFGECPA